MAMTATPESHEAREIIDRALKLSPEVRTSIAIELFESVEPPPGPSGDDRKYWTAEIVRRIEAVTCGTMKAYTLDETMSYLERVADEGDSQ